MQLLARPKKENLDTGNLDPQRPSLYVAISSNLIQTNSIRSPLSNLNPTIVRRLNRIEFVRKLNSSETF